MNERTPQGLAYLLNVRGKNALRIAFRERNWSYLVTVAKRQWRDAEEYERATP